MQNYRLMHDTKPRNCWRCKDDGWIEESDNQGCVQWTHCDCLSWNEEAQQNLFGGNDQC